MIKIIVFLLCSLVSVGTLADTVRCIFVSPNEIEMTTYFNVKIDDTYKNNIFFKFITAYGYDYYVPKTNCEKVSHE